VVTIYGRCRLKDTFYGLYPPNRPGDGTFRGQPVTVNGGTGTAPGLVLDR